MASCGRVGLSEALGPAELDLHDGLVDTEWEQDGCPSSFLFLKRLTHLVFHPITGDRRVGQYQDKLVSKADGGVDGCTNRVTNFHILRRKPAPHAFILQISVQPFGKITVCSRIADKAGVELKRIIEKERRDIVDKYVWEAASPQNASGSRPDLVKVRWSRLLKP